MRSIWMFTCVVGGAWLLSGATPKTPVADRVIEVPGADWKARATAWFKSAETPERRKEMRPAGKALKQACRYCHTPDFKGYTEKQGISRQMMALSVENDVTCAECHNGREGFTPLGEKSLEMWTLAVEKKVFCDHCHVPKQKFMKLTPQGEAHQAASKKKTP